jgi:hypothetical protein
MRTRARRLIIGAAILALTTWTVGSVISIAGYEAGFVFMAGGAATAALILLAGCEIRAKEMELRETSA